MKIVNVTVVVSPGSDGGKKEAQAVDPNFTEGLSYEIPEVGPGVWTVTDVGAPSTNFVGGKTIATTRVTVVPAPAGTEPVPTAPPASKGGFGLQSKHQGRPVQRPTQKTRHTPK